MSGFRYAHASGGTWSEAIAECLPRLESGGDAANLGFVYLSDEFAPHAGAIIDALRRGTGIDQWVGTVGIGVCSTGVEYYATGAIVALAGAFPEDSFRVFGPATGSIARLEREHGEWIARARPYFGIVHGDPMSPATAELLTSLSDLMEGGFLVGGMASSRGDYVQVAGDAVEKGFSGVLFSSEVAVSTRLTQGCSPIGTRHEITACSGNLIFELDGRRALEVLKADIGEALASDLARLGGSVYVGLPVTGSDTGEYLVRNLVGLDPTQGIVAVGEYVSPGQALMFCRRDAGAAEDDMHRMLGELAKGLKGPPRGGVYYSCIARGANLFGTDSRELKLIESELGAFPLAGFYANGEFSYNRLYAYTGVLTLFV